MDSIKPQIAPNLDLYESIQIHPIFRWEIYYRLNQLSIPCWCAMGQPLYVQIDSAIAAVQFWSVVKQTTAPRRDGIAWLESCWSL